MKSISYSELLKNNLNFRRLWCGQVISELGTWFSLIAELGLVRLLSGSAWATTALLVARLLPFLLVAPLAGVLVDRGRRKQILIATDLIRAVIALGYLTTGWGAPVWVVILCTALMSSATTFFEAAKNSTIARMVTPSEMLTANVLMFSTRFLQLSLGSALGGLTAARFGYRAAFIVNALSFLASAWFIWRIPTGVMEQAAEGEAQPVARGRFLAEVRAGLAYIWATPFVRAIILVNIAWATGGGMNNLLLDRIGGGEFAGGGRGDGSVAALYTAAGVGLLIGMLLARGVGAWANDERRAGLLIGVALLAHGVCWAAAGLMPTLWLMAALMIVSRTILGAEFGLQETLMMRVIPDELRGRVFTTDRALELTTMTLSMIVAGLALNWFAPRTMLIVSGALAASPGLFWLLALWRKRLRVPAAAIGEARAVEAKSTAPALALGGPTAVCSTAD